MEVRGKGGGEEEEAAGSVYLQVVFIKLQHLLWCRFCTLLAFLLLIAGSGPPRFSHSILGMPIIGHLHRAPLCQLIGFGDPRLQGAGEGSPIRRLQH